MKVVLFCGGLGMRMREYSEVMPKPMVPVGNRPILWHLMKYYASFGHKEFVLCLGYRSEYVKDFFLNYNECTTNDFVLSQGGRRVEVFNREIDDWTITFAETGLHANLGQRLTAVRKYLHGEEVFLANYSDGLCDLDLNAYVRMARAKRAVATFLSVRSPHSFHTVCATADGYVEDLRSGDTSQVWINGGFFVFRKEIFDVIEDGEELVEAPFRRLISRRQLLTQHHQGFWKCMDTYKDKVFLDQMFERGERPWEIWKAEPAPVPAPDLRPVEAV